MLLRIHPLNPQPRLVKQVAECLKAGGIIIYPTDTIYGMGCDILQHKAIEKICRIKNIDPQKAQLSFICSDLSRMSDYTKSIDEMGPGHRGSSPKAYILGQTREGKGIWYYYFISILFKTPVPVMASFIVSIFLAFEKKREGWYPDALFLLFPILFFLIYFDFFYNSQVGLRHILMIFPLIQVFCGNLLKDPFETKGRSFFLLAMICYSIASFYYFFPNLVPYTNELITDKKMAYKIVGSANLDYNQASESLEDYLRQNSTVEYAPETARAGKFIISTNDLLGLGAKNGYDWLRDNFKPTDHLQFTYLIFDISKQDLILKKLIDR